MTTLTIPNYVAGTWALDPAHSEIGFAARHMMVSKVHGKFLTFTGTITTTQNPLDSHAEAEIDLSSITTGDEQRDSHLRGSDFFDVAANRKMTYRSTRIHQDGGDYAVEGELTIRGITKLITLNVEIGGIGPDPYGGTRLGLTATGVISRHDFGVNWNAVIEGGGVVIGDKITIHVEVEAILDSRA